MQCDNHLSRVSRTWIYNLCSSFNCCRKSTFSKLVQGCIKVIKKFFHYSGLEMVLISMHALYLVLDGWRVLWEPQRALARSQLQHLLLSHCSLMEVVMGAVFELKSIF